MKTFKLEFGRENAILMGSVGTDDGALISTFRVLQEKYQNPDEKMMKMAFDYAVGELQSNFQGVEVAETSATVTYEEQDGKEPHEIITAENVHGHLLASGYRLKTSA